jgi:hypothetical protein
LTTKPLSVECKHGTLTAAVVCRHHVAALEKVVGFVENSSEPHDLQAWCEECEAYFEREGELSEAFKTFNDFAVVCVACYSELKTRHSRELDLGDAAWRFSDPQDLAVFTLDEVLTAQRPVLEVQHEIFDGSWQFLTGEDVNVDNGRFVRLAEVVAKDATLEQLFDLPLGWYAERASEQEPWRRHAVFPSDWAELLTEAKARAHECAQRLESEFFLLEYERYDYDQESATLVFSGADRPNLTLNIQVIGSWAAESGTWLWAWENDSILPSAKEHVHVLRRFGEQNGFQRLTEAMWEADQAAAWEMTRVACLLLQADGIYRAPDEDGALFMVVSDPEFVKG